MLCFKILPQGLLKCINAESARVRDLLVEVEGFIDEDLNILVIINGKPIDDYDFIVSSKDEVVLVQEAIGG
ncbi:MAG: hypothetical protein QXE81_04845 [Desulfurococcaceae archaeon]